jgi:ferrous iron transport protein A
VSNVALLGFADLRVGMRARVVRVDGDGAFASRLTELGLTEGAVIRVVRVAPFGDPIEIDLRGYRLCLRRSEAQCVQLEAC